MMCFNTEAKKVRKYNRLMPKWDGMCKIGSFRVHITEAPQGNLKRDKILYREIYKILKKKSPQIQCLSPTCWFQLPFFLLFTLYVTLFLIWGNVQHFQHVMPANHKEHSLLLFNKIHWYLRLVKQESALNLTFMIQQTSYISSSN